MFKQIVSVCRNKKRTYEYHKSLKFMARLERFERPTYRFVACCSIQLSYERVTKRYYSKELHPSSIF